MLNTRVFGVFCAGGVTVIDRPRSIAWIRVAGSHLSGL